METLADEFRALGSTVTVIGADLGRPGGAAALLDEVQRRGFAVDVLINNAGLGAAGRFHQNEPGRITEMLEVNIVSLTELTRALLPGMIARRRGRIMLVASIAGFQPGPRMAVYFATKAYVLSLGEALAYELRNSGVTVTTLCPGATATNFFNAAGANHSLMAKKMRRMMPSQDVARLGYEGMMAGRRVVVTGAMNRITALGGRYAPHWLTLPVTDLLMSGE